MRKYVEDIKEELPDMKQVLKSIQLPVNTIFLEEAVELLQKVYNLNS